MFCISYTRKKSYTSFMLCIYRGLSGVGYFISYINTYCTHDKKKNKIAQRYICIPISCARKRESTFCWVFVR